MISAMNSGTIPGTENSVASEGSARVSAITAPPTTAAMASGSRYLPGPTGRPSSHGQAEVEQQPDDHDQDDNSDHGQRGGRRRHR